MLTTERATQMFSRLRMLRNGKTLKHGGIHILIRTKESGAGKEPRFVDFTYDTEI